MDALLVMACKFTNNFANNKNILAKSKAVSQNINICSVSYALPAKHKM